MSFHFFRNEGVFHVEPLTHFCGCGFGFCFGFGCICGHLDEEERNNHIRSVGESFHGAGYCCCAGLHRKSNNDPEDVPDEDNDQTSSDL